MSTMATWCKLVRHTARRRRRFGICIVAAALCLVGLIRQSRSVGSQHLTSFALLRGSSCQRGGRNQHFESDDHQIQVLELREPSRRESMVGLAAAGLPILLGIVAAVASSAPVRAKELSPLEVKIQAEAEKGVRLFQEGEFKSAEEAWRRCVELDPKIAYSWANLGTCQLINAQELIVLETPLTEEATKRLEEAGVSLDKAINQGMDRDPIVLNQRANVFNLLRQWNNAIVAYDDAIRSAPTGLASIPRQNLALALFEIGDDKAAETAATTLLRKDPEFIDARALLAAIRWSRGDAAGAESSWTEICEGVQPARDGRLLGQLVESAGRSVGITRYAPRQSGGSEFCKTYSNIQVVKGRWPVKARNAYSEFLARRPMQTEEEAAIKRPTLKDIARKLQVS